MAEREEFYTLSNGVQIPKIGYGTWQMPSETGVETVKKALSVGYRHVDTAAAYGNEESVGEGIRASGLPRTEVFLTTKIPAEVKSYEGAKESIDGSLRRLNCEYIDLMLIHAPRPWEEMHGGGTEPYVEENAAVWRAMEEAYRDGKIRAIGVSNFSLSDLDNLSHNSSVSPMVNQIKAYIGNYPQALIDVCRERGILVEAYSPIATGRLMNDQKVATMSEVYGVKPSQICIKYLLQRGLLPLPKTTHEEYMRTNLSTDFTLSDADMGTLDGLNLSCRLRDQKNIGAKLEAQLNAIGIHAYEQLNATGAKAAWLQILANDPSACYLRLSALEGAIRGVDRKDLPEEVKEELKSFVRAAKGKKE